MLGGSRKVLSGPHGVLSTPDAVDRRETRFVGRQARLELVFAARGGRTVLAHAYAEPPFRVGRSFAEGPGAHMILASSAPGIFGGDDLTEHVQVDRGARVRLTSQSALQVHPVPGGEAARFRSTYEVAEEATLQCRWDPLIPFAEARLAQEIEIRLAGTASLFWSDAFMSGREGRGERWRFAALAHELCVIRTGRLEYMERYRLVPADQRLAHPWGGGDASYFGTILAIGSRDVPAMAARLHADLGRVDGLRAAADALDSRTLLVRLAASAGVCFHEARSYLERLLCA